MNSNENTKVLLYFKIILEHIKIFHGKIVLNKRNTKKMQIVPRTKMKCSQNKMKKYSELRNNNCFENKIKCFKKKHFEINVLEQIKIFY